MHIEDFPVPVTLLTDEREFGARILVHRRVSVDHENTPHCPCVPHAFTTDEAARLTHTELNRLLDADLN